MAFEPIKTGTGAGHPSSARGPGATARPETSGAATFFMGIGRRMASVYRAIGEGIATLSPRHASTSETLSPGSKEAFAHFRTLQKKAERLEKLDNPTPAQQARLQMARDDLKVARQEVVRHLRAQLLNGELYAAACREPNASILESKSFKSANPAESLTDALGLILASRSRTDKIIASGMKIDEAVSIYLYTQGAFSGINRDLRGGAPSEFVQQLSDRITSGLLRLPPFEQPVYRIVSLPPSVDRQYQEGRTVADRGLLSTTYNVDFDIFGGGTSHVMSIVGHGASAGRDISWLSESPHEKEVLFPPGTEFVVRQRDQLETPQVIGTMQNGSGNRFDSQVGLLLVQSPK